MVYRLELYQDAETSFQGAYGFFVAQDDHYGATVALNNIALCAMKENNFQKAERYFLKAYQERVTLKDTFLFSHSMLYLASVYRAQKEFERTDSVLELSEVYAQSRRSKIFLDEIYQEWSELFLDLKKYPEANDKLNTGAKSGQPYLDQNWLELKIRLFRETEQQDSLERFLDSAISFSQHQKNKALTLNYLTQKSAVLRQTNRQSAAADIDQERLRLQEELLQEKENLIYDLFALRRAFGSAKQEVSTLNENLALEQEKRKSQETLLIFSIIVALIGLIGIGIFYWLNHKLRTTTNRLQALGNRTIVAANSMSAVVFSVTPGGRIRFFNNKAKEYFSLAGASKLKSYQDFLDCFANQEQRALWARRRTQISQQDELIEVESHRDLNGQVRILNFVITAIKHKDNYQGFTALGTDVTEKHRQQQQLIKTGEELRSALKTKDRVLSLLAHDLKEGVVSSLELSKLASESEDDAVDLKKSMILIRESLAKTRTLLFKTLDWVKEQSNTQSKFKSFSVLALVKDVVKEFEEDISDKQVNINLEIGEDLKIISDPGLLRVVLRNLISNAIKFSKPKNGLIQIRESRNKEGKHLIHVVDFGAGMDTTEIKAILEGEFQESKPGTDGKKGSGMGLKFCQELLVSHGSTLQFNTSRTTGTEIYFIIPT